MSLDLAFLRSGLITYLLLIVSLTVHEWAHAIVADFLGDNTPRSQGRVTLNPMAHIDVLGTVAIPLFNIFILQGKFSLIGWGRPVMTNSAHFKHPRRDDVLVSLAGPVANLALAFVTVVVGARVAVSIPRIGDLIELLVVINVGLALFNLLPIPPLDGGTLLRHLVRMTDATFFTISRWSGVVMLVAINFSAFQNAIGLLISRGCDPYINLCLWIDPAAAAVIFGHG
jgi:Zn-dependent protease